MQGKDKMMPKRYTVVLSFIFFYLAYLYLFARYCAACWSIRYYNPHLAAFTTGLLSAYIIFLIICRDEIRLEKYKRKK